MTTPAQATIESAITECLAHKRWLERDRRLLQDVFPLSRETIDRLDERTVELLDQLTYRFTKLQDSMARRLLPSLYGFIEGETEPTAFLDILNRLEALGVLPSAEQWKTFRALWNNLARDYPESRDQTAVTLNQLHADLPDFLSLFDHLAAEYQRCADHSPATKSEGS